MSTISKKIWFLVSFINISVPILILVYFTTNAVHRINDNSMSLGLPSHLIDAFSTFVGKVFIGSLFGSETLLWILAEILVLIAGIILFISLVTGFLTKLLTILNSFFLIFQIYAGYVLISLIENQF